MMLVMILMIQVSAVENFEKLVKLLTDGKICAKYVYLEHLKTVTLGCLVDTPFN